MTKEAKRPQILKVALPATFHDRQDVIGIPKRPPSEPL
jgi:hypothetical protein